VGETKTNDPRRDVARDALGEIIEDWAASDSLEIVRQLGIRRTLLLGVDYLRRR
jgi:hypothetical protein